MNILGLIPARGGSKRIPGKNIKPLGGIPLIAWTIEAALQSGVCTDVVVSTDDEEIAETARRYGALIPGLRPVELATDTAGSADMALYEMDRYSAAREDVDALLLLQPTSPFRTAAHIRESVSLFETVKEGSVVSVTPSRSNPAWCFTVHAERLHPLLGWDNVFQRSQDLQNVYELNGAIYLISARLFRQKKRFLLPDTVPYVMHGHRASLDIDTPHDWLMAEMYLQNTPDIA